jgi:hypothetical protein
MSSYPSKGTGLHGIHALQSRQIDTVAAFDHPPIKDQVRVDQAV